MGGSLEKNLFEGWRLVLTLNLIFLINYVFQYFDFSVAFTRNYLDDLLAMPIVLWISRTMLRISYRNSYLELDLLMICFAFVFFSLGFEWILPKYIPSITADIFDVFCYGFGIVVYQLILMRQED